MDHIRNFSIIAHIDHGKSTLADRIIQRCGGLSDREMEAQVLDSMDIERERGITIKAQTAALKYTAQDGKIYNLNLIDTPGHVDFSYEVSRSAERLRGRAAGGRRQPGRGGADRGQLLHRARPWRRGGAGAEQDGPAAGRSRQRQGRDRGRDRHRRRRRHPCSAKTGMGIDEILEAVIRRMPPPRGVVEAPLRAMIIDSWFDNYVGVVMLVRVVDGTLAKGRAHPHDGHQRRLPGRAARCVHAQERVARAAQRRRGGIRHRRHQGAGGGQGGRHHHAGKEAAQQPRPAAEALPGFKEIQPQVFAGLYPTEASEYDQLRDALEKLKLNDSSLRFEPEVSQALGFGFRCGFLGLLHMEIVQERLEREFDQDLITTAPSVVYEVELGDGTVMRSKTPARCPSQGRSARSASPSSPCTCTCRRTASAPVMTLANQKRGVQMNMAYHGKQVHLTYELPLAEIVLDFFDKLKSVSAATPAWTTSSRSTAPPMWSRWTC
jgi:GTP-binding protein LepA